MIKTWLDRLFRCPIGLKFGSLACNLADLPMTPLKLWVPEVGLLVRLVTVLLWGLVP